MALVPTYVGHSTKDFISPGPVTITASDLPSGTAYGDQVSFFLRSNSGSGFWFLDPSVDWHGWGGVSTDQSGIYHQLQTYSRTYEPGLLPVTFVGNGAGWFDAQMVMVTTTPSFEVETSTIGGSSRNSNPVPIWAGGISVGLPDLTYGGAFLTFVSVQYFNNSLLTTVNTAYGFTEVADVQNWPAAGQPYGNAKIGWYTSTAPVSDKALPDWLKTVNFGGAGVVASCLALGLPSVLTPRWIVKRNNSAIIHVSSNRRRWV